eukprot:1161973-Pelagomonas_calceolata.AAC.2
MLGLVCYPMRKDTYVEPAAGSCLLSLKAKAVFLPSFEQGSSGGYKGFGVSPTLHYLSYLAYPTCLSKTSGLEN